MSDEPRVFVAMPAGGHVFFNAAKGLFTPSAKYPCTPVAYSISALASCFNRLWTAALTAQCRGEYTHFAMLHSDIEPEMGWVDTLMDELNEHKLDMISAVVPLKSDDGLTSTAVGAINDIWNQRRLTMTEIFNLPETFTNKDLKPWMKGAKREGHVLLLNTGCWLCDLRKPQWHQYDKHGNARFCFTQKDRIRLKDEKLIVEFASEDWIWSRDCHNAGLKLGATRKVNVKHFGTTPYDNQSAWGSLKRDRYD